MGMENEMKDTLDALCKERELDTPSVWAIAMAISAIDRGVSEKLVIKTLLTSLLDSHDRLSEIKRKCMVPNIDTSIRIAEIISKEEKNQIN